MKVTQVIPARELGTYTRDGWAIESSFDADDTVELNEEILDPNWAKDENGNPRYGYNRKTLETKKTVVVSGRQFVISKDDGIISREALLTTERGALLKSNRAYEEQTAELQKKVDELTKQMAATDATLKREREGHDVFSESSRKRMRALEDDLGKVKRGIGDIKYNEIVGTKS